MSRTYIDNERTSRGTCQPRRKRRVTKEDLRHQRKTVAEQMREYYDLQNLYHRQQAEDQIEAEFFGP